MENNVTGLGESFRGSIRELKKVRTLAVCGLLIAMYIVLNMLTWQVTPGLFLSFCFVCIVIAGYMFGPVPAMMVGALGDFLSWVIAPKGAYLYGLTISAMLLGLIYGLFYYRRHITWLRVLAATLVASVFITLLLNGWWLLPLRGWAVIVVERPIRAGVQVVVEFLLCIVLLPLLSGILQRLKKES